MGAKACCMMVGRDVLGDVEELEAGDVFVPSITMKLLEFNVLQKLQKIPRSDENVNSTTLDYLISSNKRSKSLVVFVSHHWFDGRGSSDIDVDAIEFKTILAGLQKLYSSVQYSKPETEVFIWIDFFCIDQVDADLKRQGVNSLAAYISACDVILTPFSERLSTRINGRLKKVSSCLKHIYLTPPQKLAQLQCLANNEHEYFGRSWCRLEMLIASCCSLPIGGFYYFQRRGNLRTDRPHAFLEEKEDILRIFPKMNKSWFKELDPCKGKTTEIIDQNWIDLLKKYFKPEEFLQEGKREKSCEKLYDNGDRYIGEWQDGLMHGNGKYLYKNGNTYDGQFQFDKMNGCGSYSFANGDKYIGEYEDGLKHGYGTYIFANGEKYEGQWQYGSMQGTGTYHYKSKNRYEGKWKDNKRHGAGTYYYAEGETIQGKWKNGKRHESLSLSEKCTDITDLGS